MLKQLHFFYGILFSGSVLFCSNEPSLASAPSLSDDEQYSLLFDIQNNRRDTVKRFLDQNGSNVEALLAGQTILGSAARANPEMLALVLRYNPNVNRVDEDGWTAVAHALKYGTLSNAQSLIDSSDLSLDGDPNSKKKVEDLVKTTGGIFGCILAFTGIENPKENRGKLAYYRAAKLSKARQKKAN